MKSLVLLYRDDNHELVIKNYPQVKDNKEYYVIGKSWYGSNVGIKKSCMEQILTKNTYRYEYHMFLPDDIKDYYFYPMHYSQKYMQLLKYFSSFI